MRLETSTPELDQAELEWWNKFSDVEDRFCWVQTPEIQKFIRGEYLRHIIKLVPPEGTILELGCGTGWLSILLAKLGAKKIVGIDFSEAQIEKAHQASIQAKVGDSTIFEVGDIFNLDEKKIEKFDVVLVHGFLHHLTTTEISQFINKTHKVLKQKGNLIIWEPVQYSSPKISQEAQTLLAEFDSIIKWLNHLPLLGKNRRNYKKPEITIRELIAQRGVGESPRGPSPKEMPFASEELTELLLKNNFEIQSRQKCLAISHLIAQEILLMKLSHRLLPNLLQWLVLQKARQIDRRILSLDSPPPNLWIFEMFQCVPLN